MPLFRCVAVLLAATLLSACASILGNDQRTQITTEPGSISCRLSGQGYDQQVRTPHELVLPKAAAPIRISCTAEGYREAVHVLDTEPDPLVFANLVFGSSIFAVIDMINGAAEKFPDRVILKMEPEAFATAAARDQWYARYRRSVERRWNDIIGNLQIACTDDVESALDCIDELKQAKLDEAGELGRLERHRRTARIPAENQARAGGEQK